MATQKTEFILTARDETRAAFDAVQGSLQRLGTATTALRGVGLAAVGLAGVGSFAALKTNIESSIDSMAGLKDSAEKTGAAVEKLSAIKSVGKIGGHDFAEAEAAIGRLNKALHGTDDESKGAGKALVAMGLDIQKLREMDPADAFMELAKAQDRFADGGGKSAAMMAVLGKSGAALIPYLKDLAEQNTLVGRTTAEQAQAADEYQKNVKRLQASWSGLSREMAGVVVGPAKDITEWMLKAQKEGGALRSVLVGVGMAMIKATGGEINPLKRAEEQADSLFKTLAQSRASLDKLKEQQGTENPLYKLVTGFDIRRLEKDIPEIERKLKAAIKHRDKLLADAAAESEPKSTALNNQTFGPNEKEKKEKERESAATAVIKSLNEQIAVKELDLATDGKLSEGQRILAKTMADVESGAIKVTAAERETIEAKGKKLVALEQQAALQAVIDKAYEDDERQLRQRLTSLDEEAVRMERQAEFYGLTEAQISVVTQARLADALAMARQSGASEAHIKDLERELEARARISDALVDIDRKKLAIDEMNEKTRAGADAARELGLTFSSAFEDAIVGGKNFSQVLAGLGQDILRLTTRKLVTEPLANSLSGMFSGFSFSSLFNGSASAIGTGSSLGFASILHDGGVVGAGGASRSVPASLFAGAPRFHSGGWPGLASDEVPAILQKGERVLSRGEVAASGAGGGDTHVTINVDAGGNSKAEGDAGNARELGRRIETAVRGVLMMEKRPGGLLSAA